MWRDGQMNCNSCRNELDANKSSYWVVPGSGSMIFCETCFNNHGDNINYIHSPYHFTNGVPDKE